MKKVISYLILFIFTLTTYSQGENYYSVEIDANYYYSILPENYDVINFNNEFNYGFSAIASKYINKLKVSTGINYSIRTFHFKNEENVNTFKERKHRLTYLNFPLLLGNIEIISRKTLNSSIMLGYSFNRIIEYNITTHYWNSEISILSEKDHLKAGSSIICGLNLSKKFNQKTWLNISLFGNYQFIPNHYNNSRNPVFRSLPDEKFSLGLKIGIEYLLFKANTSNKEE